MGWINILKTFFEVKNNNDGSSISNSSLTIDVIKDILSKLKSYVYAPPEEASSHHPIPYITYAVCNGGLYACSKCTYVTFSLPTIKQHNCTKTAVSFSINNERVIMFRMGGIKTQLYRVCSNNESNKLFIDQVYYNNITTCRIKTY